MVRQLVVSVGPEMVRGGDEEYVLRHEVERPVQGTIHRIGSFLGLDTGDLVECHAEVVDLDTGCRLYARSLHKETTALYDAWDWQRLMPTATSRVRVSLLCRVTGRNWAVFTKRWNPLTAIFHAEVVIESEEL